MKFPLYLRFFILCLCAVCFVAAVATSLCAQSQHPRTILKLKACGDLEVFDDGTVLESREGKKKTERRLSQTRLRNLRRVIAGAPCARYWKEPFAAPTDLNSKPRETARAKADDDDCNLMWMGSGAGLVEVQVTLDFSEKTMGTFPVYIVCERANQSEKDQAKRLYQRFLKRNWKRFLEDVVSATHSKSVLKDCKCR